MSLISYDAAGNRVEWRAPTEDTVARKLAEEQAGRLRYCHEARAWFVYDGALWRRDRTGVATGLVRDLARASAVDPGGRVVAAAGRPAFVAGVLRFARDDAALAVTGEAWDADPWLLGTPAGPIDLRTGAAAPADPGDGISRATAVTPAPRGADCPAWRRFLDETFDGDVELIGFLQRVLGYALSGSSAEQVIVLGCGPSGTGKSVLLATVLSVMGDYAAPAELTTLAGTDRHAGALETVRGARLVGVADGAGSWSGRRVARLAGGDGLPGGGSVATILAMSGRPPAAAADEALRGRLCVVPFQRRPAVPDRGLAERLRAEAPAILRWMIEGCLEWRASGLGRPPAIEEATAACRESQDAIGQFLDERCTREGSAGAGDLWRAWRAFAEETGEAQGSQRVFAEALADRGFRRERTNAARFYRGIGLREEVTGDAE